MSGRHSITGATLHRLARWLWPRLGAVLLAVLCCASLAVAGAPASRPRPSGIAWNAAKFTYEANGKRLAEVLQDFAASQSLPAIVADGVDGVVHGTFDTAPEDFLAAMGKAYGIVWYHDGNGLYFYPASAVRSRLFRLKGYSRQQVERMLASLNIGDRRYPLRYDARNKTLMAFGPPRHIELVSAAIDSLDNGAMESNRVLVRVFPLRYATAADRRQGDVLVPGLVTVLRGIYGGALNTGEARGQEALGASRLVSKMKAMRGMYGARLVPELQGKSDQEGTAPAPGRPNDPTAPPSVERGLRSPVNDDDTPWFEADEATNAVIVRGRRQSMEEYGYIIRRLDRRPILVELEATIIDVNADSISALGIDWSGRGANGQIAVTPVRAAPDLANTSSAGGFIVSTLWSNAGRELMARIDMLVSQGQARIVAKPKVMGVANRPAVMQDKRTAAVRVAGNLDAQLYTVEAGTTLEVTPQVHELDGGAARMKLSLYIQDGQFEAQMVDNVPVVKRSEIRTEAHVLEGESLLVGGITVEAMASKDAGVPGISRVPLLGRLFRWNSDRSARSARMFLITPRLVRDIDRLPPLSDSRPEAKALQPARSSVAAVRQPWVPERGD